MNSYEILQILDILWILRILQSSIDNNYYRVYIGTSGPTYSEALNLKLASFNELV
jgi:hypothetical protein